MSDDALSGVPVTRSASKAPTMAIGIEAEHQSREPKATKLRRRER